MSKLSAALIHFALSVFFVSLLILVIYFVWYPQPLFDLAGVATPIKVLFMVDVVIGPLLTFMFYKKGKEKVKFDLSVIALIQVIAFSYGLYTIYQGRANLLVMTYGTVYFMVEEYANNEELSYDELQPSLFSSPQLVYAEELVDFSLSGSYSVFQPIDDFDKMIAAHAVPIEEINEKYPDYVQEVQGLIEKYKNEETIFLKFNIGAFNRYVVFSVDKNRIVDTTTF